jgi:hypothetical protein
LKIFLRKEVEKRFDGKEIIDQGGRIYRMEVNRNGNF